MILKKKVRKVAWNENFVIDYCEVYKSEEYYILIFGFLSICVFVFILMFALLFGNMILKENTS